MKVVRIQNGTVAMRVPVDRSSPTYFPPTVDIVSAVRQHFQFASFPQGPALAQMNSPLAFQAGKFVKDGISHSVIQMILEGDGDIVLASDTDVAEQILESLIELLDNKFQSKLASITQRRSYASAIIVEFDFDFAEKLDFLNVIEKASGRRLSKLTFQEEQSISTVNPLMPVMQLPLAAAEGTEFSIERRAGEPFSSNRYFCIAPLKTSRHLEVLEEIEKAALSKRKKTFI